MSTVLIAGAGQLGSRYLQGLEKCRFPLNIYVQDIHGDSLQRAQQRWNEVMKPGCCHTVSFHDSFKLLPQLVDVAIVATTADVRTQVVGEITKQAKVRFWILEKVLAQSVPAIDQINNYIGNTSKAWVNTPRRIMPWYQEIKSQLGFYSPLTLKVEGGSWALACNAIHFIDMAAWWTGETLLSVNTDRLDSLWFEGKRQGNWEVLGTLEAKFSGGSIVSLSADENERPTSIKVSSANFIWSIDEMAGIAERSDGLKIPGHIVYQSELSGDLVESILENGNCELPSLEESSALHRIFIRGMQAHWKHAGNPDAIFVPIT